MTTSLTSQPRPPCCYVSPGNTTYRPEKNGEKTTTHTFILTIGCNVWFLKFYLDLVRKTICHVSGYSESIKDSSRDKTVSTVERRHHSPLILSVTWLLFHIRYLTSYLCCFLFCRACHSFHQLGLLWFISHAHKHRRHTHR